MSEYKRYRRWRACVAALAFATGLAVASSAALATHSGQDPAESEPSSTLNLLGQFVVDLEGHTTDVWALGNYAYIGAFHNPECSFDLTGVRVIDISDPTSPDQVAFIPSFPGARNNDVKAEHIETSNFSGDILVVTMESCAGAFHPRQNSNGFPALAGSGGINIFDVTDPTNPHSLKRNFLPRANGIHNTFIWQQGDNAYLLAVDDVLLDDVIVVDITKPNSPKEIARTGQNDWPDLDFSEVEGAAVFLHDVWVQDNGGQIVAYLSYWDAGLVLIDVTDPANPVFMGDSDYPNPDLSGLPPEGNGHVAAPNADGSLVILGDEDQTKAALFADSTIDGVSGTNKIGGANFGPQPTEDFFPTPGDVVDVAADFGCNPGDFNAAPGGTADVVLIERGVCFFQDKADNAEAAGFDAYIVFNDAARGDGLLTMAPRDSQPVAIPGIFTGNTLGSSMRTAIQGGLTVTVDAVAGVEDGEGFMRVVDVTDPANMVEVGTYATERTLPPDNALASGTRDAHNVVVDGTNAYWAWYYEGIRVIDFSDCQAGDGFAGCTPTEVAHWGGGADPSDIFWGVYRHTLPSGERLILGSGRDQGLYIFEDVN